MPGRLVRPGLPVVSPSPIGAFTMRVARFRREAKLLASLNHPHIASIHSVVQDGDVIGLALELVMGDDLTIHLGNGTLSQDRVTAVEQRTGGRWPGRLHRGDVG